MSRGPAAQLLDDNHPATKLLKERGVAVIDICDSERASELRELIWSDLESMNTGTRRDDPNSWKNDNLPQHTHGLFQNQHIGLRCGVSTARLETEQTWKNLFGALQCISSFDAVAWSSPLMQSREYKRELKAQKHNDDPVEATQLLDNLKIFCTDFENLAACVNW